MTSASVLLPATCGEWVQGTLDGVPCLVSCAIDWHARVDLELRDPHGSDGPSPGKERNIRVQPGNYQRRGEARNTGDPCEGYPPALVGPSFVATPTLALQRRPSEGGSGAGHRDAAPAVGIFPERWSLPADRPKAVCALHRALAERHAPAAGGTLAVHNPLPRGRGYASSTVDVAGTIYAVGQTLGTPFTPAEVARLATAVEPSDSIMFAGPTLLAHRNACFYRPLGPSPRLAVIVLDPGGCVDTLSFNRADHGSILKSLAPRHRDLFAMLEAGLMECDPALVAQAATGSALAHQQILFSQLVESVYTWMGQAGALGICRAHSGTLVGLLCDPDRAQDVAAAAAARLPGVSVRLCRAV